MLCAQRGERGVESKEELLSGRWPTDNRLAVASWGRRMERVDAIVPFGAKIVDAYYFSFFCKQKLAVGRVASSQSHVLINPSLPPPPSHPVYMLIK